jgi:hypothetical protein
MLWWRREDREECSAPWLICVGLDAREMHHRIRGHGAEECVPAASRLTAGSPQSYTEHRSVWNAERAVTRSGTVRPVGPSVMRDATVHSRLRHGRFRATHALPSRAGSMRQLSRSGKNTRGVLVAGPRVLPRAGVTRMTGRENSPGSMWVGHRTSPYAPTLPLRCREQHHPCRGTVQIEKPRAFNAWSWCGA